jgi:hypothetical protein
VRSPTLKTTAAAALAIALATIAALGGGGANARALVSPDTTATPKGVGAGLRLGRTIDALRGEGLIGGAGKGCELARGERVAPLRPPFQGLAHFYPGRRLSALGITGGAETASGVGIGTPAGQARKAYPRAAYDPPPPRAPIQLGFIWIGGRFHPKMTLVIDPDSHRVSEIAIPYPSICE